MLFTWLCNTHIACSLNITSLCYIVNYTVTIQHHHSDIIMREWSKPTRIFRFFTFSQQGNKKCVILNACYNSRPFFAITDDLTKVYDTRLASSFILSQNQRKNFPIFTARKRSCKKGNVFTHACPSTVGRVRSL